MSTHGEGGYLDLYATRITDEGLDAIGRMAELRYVYLSASGLTDAGLERLSALSGIVELGLDGTAVSEWGHLNRSESLLTECQAMFLDAGGLEASRGRLSWCRACRPDERGADLGA